MSSTQSILIVEDEVRLAHLLRDYLVTNGFTVELAHEGAGVAEQVSRIAPSLIVLDLMLPGLDGMEVCKAVRAFSDVPIIMTTARVEEIDRLLGLKLGADDYVCKPYSPREVVARIKAILRRTRSVTGADATTPTEADGPGTVALDESRLEVRVSGNAVELSAVEFALFATLYAHPGQIFSRGTLMDKIYNDHRVVSDRTIDSHVKKLRRKLSVAMPEGELVHSVYGVGYRYEAASGE
jgi:two-component system, OmpR family, response regulator BaeR